MRDTLIRLLLTLAVVAEAEAGSIWPQFRGPQGNGIAPPTNAPSVWSETENVTWKTEIPGKGWSSPVLADGIIWLTTAIEEYPSEEEAQKLYEKKGTNPAHINQRQIAKKITLRLLAVDAERGKILRSQDLIVIDEPEPIHKFNSYASPTPVIDGENIYCHFGTFGTQCLKREDLSIVWERKIPLEHAVGPGSSPFIHNDLLVLICDGVDQQYVTALNKKTGESVWKTDRPPMDAPDGDQKKAYDTPIAAVDANGREQILCMGSQWLVSYEPATGKELWKVNHGKGFSVVPRPVVGNGLVFISTGYGRPQLWAIRIDGTGDVTETHVVWKETKRIPAKPSPLLIDDLLYVIDDAGIATCFNANDGTVFWTERVPGNYSASPLFAGGKIFFCNEEGKTTVLRPSQSYDEIAVNQLDGRIMASPIALDNALYLRTDTALYRINAP